jgi:hypothetical protein
VEVAYVCDPLGCEPIQIEPNWQGNLTMPMANDLKDHGRLVRTLIYGKDKTKKTWWACRASEDGYNVILLDGDDGGTIVRNLPPEAQKKILLVNLCNLKSRAVFAQFMATFCRGDAFIWDETERVSLPVNAKLNPTHSHVYFDPDKFTNNDVIVLDSWTALAMSTALEFSLDQNISLTEIERDGDNFAMPNFQARFLDYVLDKIKTWKGHAIVVGHEMNWEKYKGKGKDRKIVGDYIQPISSTGPQGQKLGKFFENVLRFTRLSDISYSIDAGGDDGRAGGSRLIAPQKYKWEQITPQSMMASLGAKPTGEPCHGAIWLAPGEQVPVLAKSNTTNTQVVETVRQAAETPSSNSAPATKVLSGGSSLAQRLALGKPK